MTSRIRPNGRDFSQERDRYLQTMDALGAYGWSPLNLIPVGSGFKVESPRGPRFLKRFRFGPQEICLVHDILEHLRSRGFHDAPRVYLTRTGEPYIHIDGEILYLQDWHDLSRPDMAEPGILRTAVEIMARLHEAGERFRPRPGLGGLREDYGSWAGKSVERLRDLYGFAELASDGRHDSKFDSRYAKAAPAFCRQAEEAVRRLADSRLRDLAQEERKAGAVCHRNFTPRNLVLDSRLRLRLLDFDSAGLEIRLEDLAKFIRRAADLDLERAAFILQGYGQARGRPLSREETGLIGAYLLFPTEFWAVGKSCYQKDHRRSRTLRRLLESAEQRARFAKVIGGLDLPAEPVLVTLPGPQPVSGPGTVDVPDVPDGPDLPATPAEPDQVVAIPLELVRMDAIDLPAGNFEEVAVPMSEETPIYQAWKEPEPDEEPVLVFAQPAPDESDDVPDVDSPAAKPVEPQLEPGTPLVIPPSLEPEAPALEAVSASRLVWRPLPQPARPIDETLDVQTAAADEPGEVTAEIAEEAPEEAADEVTLAFEPEQVQSMDMVDELVAAPPPVEVSGADDLEPQCAAPADDQAPSAEETAGPAVETEPEETVKVAPAAPGPRTIVWGKWPPPVQPRDES